MLNYFIDGSNKGLVVGAGVVEVNRFGFMKTYEDHSMHPNADPYFAELFALNIALDKAIDSNTSIINIFVDTYHIENLFKHKLVGKKVEFLSDIPLASEDYHLFATSVRKKVEFFYAKKFNASLKITKLTEEKYEYTVYTNTAHVLSRCYFNKYDRLYLQDDSPLKKAGDVAKLELNNATKCLVETSDISDESLIKFRVEREGDFWYSFLGSQKEHLVKSKHLVNIFYHSYNNVCKEMDKDELTFEFDSKHDLIDNINKSVNYINCPIDIKKKGQWILESFDNEKFILA